MMTFHPPLLISMRVHLHVTRKPLDGVCGVPCPLWPAEHHREVRNLGQSAECYSGKNFSRLKFSTHPHHYMTLFYSGRCRSLVKLFCCLCCLVLSCLVLSCLVLSCLVLSCLVLSCLVLSCLLCSHNMLSVSLLLSSLA